MTNLLSIRPATEPYLAAIADIAETSGLFPGDMLPDMIALFLGQEALGHIWLVACQSDEILAFVYCEPERMTVSTSNILALATRKTHRSAGIGSQLVRELEDLCRVRGDRILLVETAGLPEFDRTRAFYTREEYKRIATLPDFYDSGEDKVVFMKRLI